MEYDDSTDSDDNLCFMALNDDEVRSTTSSVAYEKLSDMYDKLCKEMIKLERKKQIYERNNVEYER